MVWAWFVAPKSSIMRGSPCGCSPSYQRTLDQVILAVKRIAHSRHHKYVGINYVGISHEVYINFVLSYSWRMGYYNC